MLHVHTARVSYKGPDRFDVTRRSGGATGTIFAPSWSILRPALDARRLAEAKAKEGLPDEAARIDLDAWETYVPRYKAEMVASEKRHPDAWRALLARARVVLCCYCTAPTMCHRSLLAAMLARRGAVVQGELPREMQR